MSSLELGQGFGNQYSLKGQYAAFFPFSRAFCRESSILTADLELLIVQVLDP